MTSHGKSAILAGAILCLTVATTAAQTTAVASSRETQSDRVVFSHALPLLDGRHLKATIVEVTYGPGESSPPHSHPCAVIGYVLEGALRTRVQGEPEAVYKAGESFYEAPNGVHKVSANLSDAKPAKFLAYFVCDRDTQLSVAVPETKRPGGK